MVWRPWIHTQKKEAEQLLLPFPHQRLLLGLFGSIQWSKKPSGPSAKDTFACVIFLSILIVLVWRKCLHFLQYDGSRWLLLIEPKKTMSLLRNRDPVAQDDPLCCEQFSSEHLSFCVTVQNEVWIHSWASGELTALAGVAAQARTMALTLCQQLFCSVTHRYVTQMPLYGVVNLSVTLRH